MFGKSILRLISLAVAGIVALVLGSSLLSSVTSVVIAWRVGNPVPLILVCLGTVVLLLISRLNLGALPSMVLEVVSWIAGAYLSVIVFFMLLPFGFIAGIVGFGSTLVVVGLVKDTGEIVDRFSTLLDQATSVAPRVPLLAQMSSVQVSPTGAYLKGYIIPHTHRSRMIAILRERPALPMSLARWGDVDVLFLRLRGVPALPEQVRSLFADNGIVDVRELSPFMIRAIMSLPMLEQREAGLSLDAYKVATDQTTVERLIEIWPERITVFAHSGNPLVMVRYDLAPGFETHPIPRGLEPRVVLELDPRHIEPPTGDIRVAAKSNA